MCQSTPQAGSGDSKSSPNANDELACPEEPNEMVQEHPLQAMVPDELI